MRNKLLIATALLTLAVWAGAQQTPSQSPASPDAAAGAQAPSAAQPDAQQPQEPSAAPDASEAQQGAQQPSASPSAAPAAAGDAVEGCLGGSNGNFTVTDDSGTIYQLQLPAKADTSVLNQHLGEKIRVTGSKSEASATASGASAGGHAIQVRSIDKIPGTCGAKSGATPPSKD